MKNIRFAVLLAASLMGISCMKDGDMLIGTLEGGSVAINAADDNIVLSKDKASDLVLTLYWNESGKVVLNHTEAQVPSGMVVSAVQFSADDTFGTVYEHKIGPDVYSLQLTGAELNRILSELGYEGGVKSPLYIRMSTSIGNNVQPAYGETAMIQVTSFAVDMGRLQIAQSVTGGLTGEVSYIPAADGGYKGLFMAPSGWYNCFFIEGDGTIWGAYADGNPFPLEKKSNTSSWNVWFPEPSGFYYVDVDTENAEWSAVSIPSFSLGAGETAVEMTFIKAQKALRGVFTTSSDNVALKVSAEGDIYDKIAGTGDVAGQKSFSLVSSGDKGFIIVEGDKDSGITAGKAGTYTLLLHTDTMTWELKEGEPEPEPEPEPSESMYAYWSWESGWVTTDLASTLVKENDLYFGYISSFGENTGLNRRVVLYNEPLSGEGYAYDNGGLGCDNGATGNLGAITSENSNKFWPLWFDVGLYRLEVNGDNTESNAISLKPYIANASNLWKFTEMTFLDKKWSITMDLVAGETFKIVLSTDGKAWTYEYSGSDNVLRKPTDNNDNIFVSEAGTYKIEVDLRYASNLTYTITKQ